jgi:O-antigen/teichoic acid export membrane protein
MESLSPKVIRSGLWSLGGNWLIRGLGIIKMIILARLLAPIDFGVIGLSTLAIYLFNVFSETGLESALIQKNKIGRAELDSVWTLKLIRGLILFTLLFVSAKWFALYFNNATLDSVLKAIAIVFILGGLVNVGVVFFQRDLEFKKKVRLELASEIVGAVVTILLAFWLRNIWALVLGNIALGVTKCIGSYCMHSYRPRLYWNWSIAKNLLNFGKHIYWISIVTFIVTSGDDALVGKILGLTVLGFYTMAYNIANIPVSSLAGIIGRISFPAYSILQKEPVRLSEAFSKIVEAALLFLTPLTVLIILLAKDFTIIFLGEKWLPIVPVLRILSLLGFFRGLANVFSPIHLAVNRPEIQSRNKTIELILFLLLVYPFTVKWGLVGTSWAVTTVYIVSAVINILSCLSIVPKILSILLNASWVPLLASFGLMISTWITHRSLSAVDGLIQFFLSVFVGLVVFGVIAITSRKDLFQTLCMSIRSTKSSTQT